MSINDIVSFLNKVPTSGLVALLVFLLVFVVFGSWRKWWYSGPAVDRMLETALAAKDEQIDQLVAVNDKLISTMLSMLTTQRQAVDMQAMIASTVKEIHHAQNQ